MELNMHQILFVELPNRVLEWDSSKNIGSNQEVDT
jgi:hypothetical protein